MQISKDKPSRDILLGMLNVMNLSLSVYICLCVCVLFFMNFLAIFVYFFILKVSSICRYREKPYLKLNVISILIYYYKKLCVTIHLDYIDCIDSTLILL